ncbi:MAG: type I restriction endonuclease subunit R [Caldilineaceae bacterium]|nr:type I restriction endonuclease subunit R [Caldilineaceae bacterium]
MQETLLQERFILPFLTDTLGYREIKPNTVSNSLIIEEDLQEFIATSTLNAKNYATLLRKYGGDQRRLLADLIELIQERAGSSRNVALFLNSNKTVTLRDVRLHLFYPSDSLIHGDDLFAQNIFSVVPELAYIYKVNDQPIFSFRPDLCFFVNGIYLGYSELKSNFMGQNANKNGRSKVVKDYFDAVRAYHEYFDTNLMLADAERTGARRDLLKVFERAVHLTATDVGATYVIRNLADYFDEMLSLCRGGFFDRYAIEQQVIKDFKPYPLRNPHAEKGERVKEIFTAHYGKAAMEKEILYYNFIEREVYTVAGVKELKDERGALIAPRPKQKFGTDKIIDKIDEFLAHEGEDDYFLKQLEAQLAAVSPDIRRTLIEKRRAYNNNKHVYSLLLQYAAGFGKSNIIGWATLQLKDLRRNGDYVYDKIMIVVDRLQLRSQIDAKMLNMNIDKKMFIEAHNKSTFLAALASDTRIVIVNLQKFGSVRRMLTADVLEKLASMRIAFLIDEIHRSHSGDQHEEMVNIFDELQAPFDSDTYNRKRKKKNVIIGFTATPDDRTLARFGEFSGYAESEKLWVPFDSYTMLEAIEDGFILNPLANIVPVAAKMLFDLPANKLKGFTKKEYKDIEKQQIYENRERIDAIAAYVADLLVKDVYRQIRGTAKAMLAVYSIDAAIAYKDAVTRHFNELVKDKKYARYADAPIYIVYSDSQSKQKAARLNDGRTEYKVLQDFALRKNGLIIVVAKLQTGFDEKRLHTLFLDKEIRSISAIQTISRVNRTMKNKFDCKIVDFSHNNVNVQNIKDAFEHFSNVVVSDFDPFKDVGVLELLYTELKKSDVYVQFFPHFIAIYKNDATREDPKSYLNLESDIEKFIQAHPRRTADAKAKAAQYYTILNRIEYVITLDKKYSDGVFLAFYRKFNTLYNTVHRVDVTRDPIEVYYANDIGIIEAEIDETKPRTAKETRIAEGREPSAGVRQLSILEIIEARNQQEEEIGVRIADFKAKMDEFFAYVRSSSAGERLIVKIKSRLSEDEIYDDFGKIYRSYRAFNRKKVGDYFFTVTQDIVEKLCDEFESEVLAGII